MRGEFIGVWSETWREIWTPLIEHEDVPEDIFCELYRELAKALKAPSTDAAVDLTISDSIQLREAFDRALFLAGVDVDLVRRDEVFDSTVAASGSNVPQRKEALETALLMIITDPAISKNALSKAISELINDPRKRTDAFARAVESTTNDRLRSREAFEQTQTSHLVGEWALISFLEAAHGVIDDLGGDPLSNLYFNLLAAFIDKFSLRYDLRRPCVLCPTLTGVFASLVGGLCALTSRDTHLDSLMKEFENAIRDLRADCTDGRIKTCIQKQINLLEAIGRGCPGVTATTLGAICNEVGTWPHEKVKEAMKSLYGFASDYPGIRHGGTPASALRAIEMRDLVAMSILLAGFTPYLSDQLNAEVVYRGS